MCNVTHSMRGIAITGLAGRFPGAKNVDQFWKNLRDGVESISRYTNDELTAQGIPPATLNDPNYVKAAAVLENVEMFDATFFDISPGEAEIMDPQQRLFLEAAWIALENAGYNAENYEGLIGVYAGNSGMLSQSGAMNDHMFNVYFKQKTNDVKAEFHKEIVNENDYLATRVSYKLNLRGPSFTVRAACATSLVAVHLACQSLLNYECDIALAGGVTINPPQTKGYFYQEGMISSPDGHCRAFDAKAQGTVFGQGVGVVVLKRLSDAMADGDTVHAVIKSSAINNDGACKDSYTAPGIDGQAEVTKTGLALAEIDPETITYIETHGTGTLLGDPVEIAALTKAFRASTNKKGFCAIGSLKTNIGHLGPTSGVAGLIKTVLALEHKEIPPSLHFEKPNPKIDFENSPFYVNTKLKKWQSNGTPRRAGVSAFGVGGTNAHVVLEEAPVPPPSENSRPYQLLVLSSKTNSALETASANILTHLKHHPNLNLADVAYTLQVGRKAFSQRRILVCTDRQDAISALENADRVFTSTQQPQEQSVAFLFTGQGAQYVNMGLEVYQHEPVFRKQVDECAEILRPYLGLDLRHVMYPTEESEEATEQLMQTALAQPALFMIEYALAKLWMSWDMKPEAMIGHSIGEYVAACLAGVFSLQEALALVAARGRMMQNLPAGTMLAVFAPSKEIVRLLSADDQMARVSLAAINGPSLCVVSGPSNLIKTVETMLSENGLEYQRLHTSHAFHSPVMDPIVVQFTEEVKKVKLKAPTIPYISNLTGRWIKETEATDPTYWGRHLRETVRFSDGVQELLKKSRWNLLELGPGKTLCTLVRQHSNHLTGQLVLSCLHHPNEQKSDLALLLTAIGRLWLKGVEIDWVRFYANERRRRIPLPTYPFEPQRYWVEPQKATGASGATKGLLYGKKDLDEWFYVPSWKRCPLSKQQGTKPLSDQKQCWLVFLDECGMGAKLVNQLQQDCQRVMTVKAGTEFSQANEESYTICPRAQKDYNRLFKELRKAERAPNTIVHLWCLTGTEANFSGNDFLEVSQNMGFNSLLFLVQAIDNQFSREPIQIKIISNHLQDVTGEEVVIPEKAILLGPCLVTSQEYPNIQCTSVDIVLPKSDAEQEKLLELLIEELSSKTSDAIVTYRGKYRWVQTFESIRLEKAADLEEKVRKNGVYLITGGLGAIGLTLAEYLAKTVQAKLALIARTILPARGEWDQWLRTHSEHDTISRKIRKVQSVEEMGADVLLLSADVTDVIQMQAAVKKTHDQFGAINGVVHAAGIAGAGLVQLKTPELAQSVLAPKVKGTLVLDKLLSDVDLDFFILSSSINSLLGGVGQVDYCAANAFLDAYARQHHSRNTCISINWCAWQGIGMAVDTVVPEDLKEEREQSLKLGILPKEGKEAFSRILGSSFPQVVVSTQDFLHQVELIKNTNARDPIGITTKASSRKSTYARPNLSSAYVVPSNPTEQTVADIWQQVLAVEKVGIHDNFFDLGGHSLLVARVVALLRKAFPVEFPMGCVFEMPTVYLLSKMILDEQNGGAGDPSFVESMSRGQKRKKRRLQKLKR